MIHFNDHKKNAFTLIEAVIAIAIIGIVVVGVFSLQQAVFRNDIVSNEQLSRVFLLKNALYDPAVMREDHDQEIKKEQRIKEPPTEIKLIVGKATGKLLKAFKYIERIVAQAKWEGIIGSEQEELLFLRFKAPVKTLRQAPADAEAVARRQDDR